MVTPDWCGTFWGSTPKGVPGLNQYINGKDPHLHHKSTKKKMDSTLLRLEEGFAAAVRTMCLAHGHMDLASRWQHQLQDPDRAMPCAAGLRVRVDFALAAETYIRITVTEPPGSLATMMASMMDGQRRRPSRRSPLPCGGDCLPIPARHGGGDRRRSALAARGAGHGLWLAHEPWPARLAAAACHHAAPSHVGRWCDVVYIEQKKKKKKKKYAKTKKLVIGIVKQHCIATSGSRQNNKKNKKN